VATLAETADGARLVVDGEQVPSWQPVSVMGATHGLKICTCPRFFCRYCIGPRVTWPIGCESVMMGCLHFRAVCRVGCFIILWSVGSVSMNYPDSLLARCRQTLKTASRRAFLPSRFESTVIATGRFSTLQSASIWRQ